MQSSGIGAEPQPGNADFTRVLPENSVEYAIFLDEEGPNVPSGTHTSRLKELQEAALKLSQDLTAEYIWQREPFNLQVKTEQELSYLYGITNFGDSVEDEWLIVYILRRLSRTYPSLWLRVSDSDGEFLLIEAANVLPAWLNPEIDRNRAWIHGGKLFIIPVRKGVGGTPNNLSLADALSIVRSSSDQLVQSDLIEAEAFYRLEKYPKHIAHSLHYSVVSLPRKLVSVLRRYPGSIAPAVEAFYLRDAFALKPLFSPNHTLRFPPENLVPDSVKFSKVLFAQLRSQRFDPPPSWSSIIEGAGEGKSRARLEMGMKIACGFEMMLRRLDKTENAVAHEVGRFLDDLEKNEKENGRGNPALPTDDLIQSRPGASRDDDESWMNIDYDEFERELQGGSRKGDVKTEPTFGDATAQADLRKLVSRFEAFLNDDKAGFEGAEVDDMDVDNDSDSEESEDEDKAVSFDEEAFAKMMREMMGLPANENESVPPSNAKAGGLKDKDDQDEEGIQALSAQFEAELQAQGALKLNSAPKYPTTIEGKTQDHEKGKGKGKGPATISHEDRKEYDDDYDDDNDEDSDADGETDIDYNLARNLLESFKSQAGMAGPAGNMLGMMGIQLPRDEGEENEKHVSKK